MGRERIDIHVCEQRLAMNEERRARLEAVRRFEPVDHVPVQANVNQWYVLDQRGVSAGQYVSCPRENLRQQLLNHKWRLEQFDEDLPIPADVVTITPDLGCLRGTEFEMEVIWQEGQPPKCEHPLQAPEQVDALSVPDPAGGVNRIRLDWYRRMRDLAEEFNVRLNGERLEVRVSIGQPGGPIPAAYALAGDNLLLWLSVEPERAAKLLSITAESHINCIGYFDELCGRPTRHAVGMGCDIGEMLGPTMFRQFVVPAYERVWQAYPGRRSLHMCGDINHLFEALRDDLRIDELNGFGFPVDPAKMAEAWSGRVVMIGGPSPMLVKAGPSQRIVEESHRYIDCLNRRGGYILSLGGGAAVGTPVEHLRAMINAPRAVASHG
ncbi:MAG: uroporphyrinogen decarboxylase family protein [bacterium]